MKTALKCCLLMTRAGKGVGKLLLQHAIAEFGANEVDVNEQNPQGVAFYRHMGFEQVGRSELDGQGNPFPLLHMRLGGQA
jgi:putative acetyltransferase